jgi:hypothetical protein
MVPVELFGRTAFPAVGERAYLFTLGSHVFYWFVLQAPPSAGVLGIPVYDVPKLAALGDWDALVQGAEKHKLEEILPPYLLYSRWFGGKEKKPKAARIVETFALEDDANPCICIIEVEYDEAEPERYALPLASTRRRGLCEARSGPPSVLAELGLPEQRSGRRRIIGDAIWPIRSSAAFCSTCSSDGGG